MIDVKELLYDIDLKLNKIGSNEHQGIELENKIIALNDAHINIVKTKFSENNIYKVGLDGSQKRINDLEILVEKDKFLPLTNDHSPLKSWSASLDLLKPEYMLGIPGSEYIVADKGSCKSNPLVINLVKSGDINITLKNTNTSPSFEYQEVPGTISGHKWQIYTDGSFTPTRMYLWYVRYPKKVDFEGYTHFDGKPSTVINSELPYYLKEEIVDIAVRSLGLSTENQNAVQASQIKIQTNE
jgi:hypothetical protein